MSVAPALFFDDAVPALAKEIARQLGGKSLANGLIVRDTSGRLRFFAAEKSPTESSRAQLEESLRSRLGAQIREDAPIVFGDDPGVGTLLQDPAAFVISHDSLTFRLLDRRIVGSAWVDPPRNEASGPPRIVFASLKGGVGRSTALAITAADLARRNNNVLVVDLDLEAPGLGSLLLEEDRLPQFGAIDYLVETGLGGVPDQQLPHFVGTSALTTGLGGRVDVIPALGRKAIDHPENTLPKLSRAMIEDISDGVSVSVTDKIAQMLQRLTDRDTYDVVLIDSRAGLSELAASSVLGLGATVLLFGAPHTQTLRGYAALFAALKLLAQRDRAAGNEAAWRLRFKAVYAKAGFDKNTAARYQDELYELFADGLYDAQIEAEQSDLESISFGPDDENAPHFPLIIPFAQNLIDFDPVQTPSHLTTAFYEQLYRPFLNGIDRIIASSGPNSGPFGSDS